jgi:hypothetical protein
MSEFMHQRLGLAPNSPDTIWETENLLRIVSANASVIGGPLVEIESLFRRFASKCSLSFSASARVSAACLRTSRVEDDPGVRIDFHHVGKNLFSLAVIFTSLLSIIACPR